MFHRSSLLMTGLVLVMAVAWFGMEHFELGAGGEAGGQVEVQADASSPGETGVRLQARGREAPETAE